MSPTQPAEHSPSRAVAAGHHRAAGCDVTRLAVVTDQAQSSVQGQEATSQEARSQEVVPQDATPQEATPGAVAFEDGVSNQCDSLHIRLSQQFAPHSNDCNVNDHQALLVLSTAHQTERQ